MLPLPPLLEGTRALLGTAAELEVIDQVADAEPLDTATDDRTRSGAWALGVK